MNAKLLGFVMYVKAIINLLLYDLHECTFESKIITRKGKW